MQIRVYTTALLVFAEILEGTRRWIRRLYSGLNRAACGLLACQFISM